jgi:hypothetical protein
MPLNSCTDKLIYHSSCSQLLEGLQSSLMVTKIPSVSHDRSQKNRTAARGNFSLQNSLGILGFYVHLYVIEKS